MNATPASIAALKGTNSTARTVRLVRRARELGAAGTLIVTPYYNKPTDAGIVAHHAAIAEAAPGFPVIAYNVPGRTGVNVSLPAIEKLWRVPGVVALKESTGSLQRISEIARTLPRAAVPAPGAPSSGPSPACLRSLV